MRNLSFYPIDLHLDPEQAQREASELGMLLALRSEGDAATMRNVWEDLHMRHLQTTFNSDQNIILRFHYSIISIYNI